MIIDGWKFLQSENSEKIVNFSEITIVRSKLHKQMIAHAIINHQLDYINTNYQKKINECLLDNITIDEFNGGLSSYKMKSTQNDIMLFPIFDELPFKFDKKINSENVLRDIFGEFFLVNNSVKSNMAMNYIKSIISEWAKQDYNCGNIEFLLSGSKLLNTDISDSDVDANVILTKFINDGCKINEINKFFGNPSKDLCQNTERSSECNDFSLYCILCQVRNF
uniref:Uncharacterized protein n=1 Tax=Meloidogyne enterolobii TaxID=390850 RepID=A0A6V7X3I5_MELEN|nr:unnamed protein product [Meloidogyne enterolobii]